MNSRGFHRELEGSEKDFVVFEDSTFELEIHLGENHRNPGLTKREIESPNSRSGVTTTQRTGNLTFT